MASDGLLLPGPSTSTSDPDSTANRPIPSEALEQGLWEVEIVYYTLGHRTHSTQYNGLGNGDTKKQRRGKVYKVVGESEYKCFEAHDGVCYWPGDAVYIETTPGEPFIVGTINMFKPTKRETISCKLTRYYRPEDIPEVTYSLLIQERKEHGSFEETNRHASRELFSSEFPVNYSVSFLSRLSFIPFHLSLALGSNVKNK
uniref:BAH domain-containing protein n=1 Tax=Panagrellus redivivus TaxID=6233 RepID=A0A7E4VYT8_PANRE